MDSSQLLYLANPVLAQSLEEWLEDRPKYKDFPSWDSFSFCYYWGPYLPMASRAQYGPNPWVYQSATWGKLIILSLPLWRGQQFDLTRINVHSINGFVFLPIVLLPPSWLMPCLLPQHPKQHLQKSNHFMIKGYSSGFKPIKLQCAPLPRGSWLDEIVKA